MPIFDLFETIGLLYTERSDTEWRGYSRRRVLSLDLNTVSEMLLLHAVILRRSTIVIFCCDLLVDWSYSAIMDSDRRLCVPSANWNALTTHLVLLYPAALRQTDRQTDRNWRTD